MMGQLLSISPLYLIASEPTPSPSPKKQAANPSEFMICEFMQPPLILRVDFPISPLIHQPWEQEVVVAGECDVTCSDTHHCW